MCILHTVYIIVFKVRKNKLKLQFFHLFSLFYMFIYRYNKLCLLIFLFVIHTALFVILLYKRAFIIALLALN